MVLDGCTILSWVARISHLVVYMATNAVTSVVFSRWMVISAQDFQFLPSSPNYERRSLESAKTVRFVRPLDFSSPRLCNELRYF